MTTVPHDIPDAGEHPSSDGASLQTYLIVFAALILLLFLSVALAYRPVDENSPWRNVLTAAGFIIAGVKAVIIILWFMHVKYSPKLTWVFAAAAFIWLGILIGLSMTDFTTRHLPPGAHREQPRLPVTGAAYEHRPNGTAGMEINR
jgi:cytochrome c oxidase subunit 4